MTSDESGTLGRASNFNYWWKLKMPVYFLEYGELFPEIITIVANTAPGQLYTVISFSLHGEEEREERSSLGRILNSVQFQTKRNCGETDIMIWEMFEMVLKN